MNGELGPLLDENVPIGFQKLLKELQAARKIYSSTLDLLSEMNNKIELCCVFLIFDCLGESPSTNQRFPHRRHIGEAELQTHLFLPTQNQVPGKNCQHLREECCGVGVPAVERDLHVGRRRLHHR